MIEGKKILTGCLAVALAFGMSLSCRAECFDEEINERDREILACVIYQEAGGDAASDLCRKMVGDVVLNRVDDERFPDTIEEVLTQEGQYGNWSETGIVWPKRASNAGEAEAVKRAYRIAEELLRGEHSDLYGNGYIWQAQIILGVDNVFADGLYFGR